jgi:hypothetical protein
MEPDRSNDQDVDLIEVRHRLDAALRDQFPVIVDFNRRLENLERKIERIRDLAVLTVAVGLGIAFGEIVENVGNTMSWGWPAAVTCGATILAVIFIVRSFLK